MDIRAGGLAERVRAALLRAAVEAYEDAGLRGLCAEGRWEYAVGVMGTLDLGAVCDSQGAEPPPAPESGRAAPAADGMPLTATQPN